MESNLTPKIDGASYIPPNANEIVIVNITQTKIILHIS